MTEDQNGKRTGSKLINIKLESNEHPFFVIVGRFFSSLSAVGIALSAIFAAYQLSDFVDSTKRANDTVRLTALKQVQNLIATDDDIKRTGYQFRSEQQKLHRYKLSCKKASASVAGACEEFESQYDAKYLYNLLRKYGSGEGIYLSKEMEKLATVHYHYEQMGTLVRLGYVDFRLIYEIIAFPDQLWFAIQPLQTFMAKNWKGLDWPEQDQSLSDLGENFGYLWECYKASRDAAVKAKAAGQKPPIPACPAETDKLDTPAPWRFILAAIRYDR